MESVRVALEKRQMQVHARALHAFKRLGHECGMHVAHRCNLFDNKAEGHDAVSHGECVGVAQIDFVLAG